MFLSQCFYLHGLLVYSLFVFVFSAMADPGISVFVRISFINSSFSAFFLVRAFLLVRGSFPHVFIGSIFVDIRFLLVLFHFLPLHLACLYCYLLFFVEFVRVVLVSLFAHLHMRTKLLCVSVVFSGILFICCHRSFSFLVFLCVGHKCLVLLWGFVLFCFVMLYTLFYYLLFLFVLYVVHVPCVLVWQLLLL